MNHKHKKEFFKNLIIGFLVSILLGLTFKTAYTVISIQNKEWNELKSTYDLKGVYWKLVWTGKVEGKLRDSYLSQNNRILQFIDDYRFGLYKKAENTIPKGDIELCQYYYLYKYYPLLKTNNLSLSEEKKREVLSFMENIIMQESLSKSFNETRRFILIDTLSNWIEQQDKRKHVSRLKLLDIYKKAIKKLNYQDFLYFNSHRYYTPFSLIVGSLNINAKWLLNTCNEVNLRQIEFDIEHLFKLREFYKSKQIKDGFETFVHNKKQACKTIKNIKTLLANICNINWKIKMRGKNGEVKEFTCDNSF